MEWIACVLAVLAVAVFLCAYFAVPRKWAKVELGLVLLTLAWMAQLIIVTGKHLTIS